MKDHYQTLGIKREASTDEIKKTYKKLAIKFHPDKNDGDKFFEERFKEIQEAYELLSDKFKKEQYDNEYDYFYNGQHKTSHNIHLQYEKTWVLDYQYVVWGILVLFFEFFVSYIISAFVEGSNISSRTIAYFIIVYVIIKIKSIMVSIGLSRKKNRNHVTWTIVSILTSGISLLTLGLLKPKRV